MTTRFVRLKKAPDQDLNKFPLGSRAIHLLAVLGGHGGVALLFQPRMPCTSKA